MKTLAWFLSAVCSLVAGELRVTIPNDGLGVAVVESMIENNDIESSKQQIQQEGQLIVFQYQNLKPGKYRVSYVSSLDPLAVLTTIMETRIEIHEESKESVILFQPFERKGPAIPKEINEFLMNHRENHLTLNVTYDGCETLFDLTRGRFSNICALRSDGKYHLKQLETQTIAICTTKPSNEVSP